MLSIFSFHTFLCGMILLRRNLMKKRMSVLRLRMGVRIGLKRFFPFGSQNMLIFEGWHSTSTVSGISATSPAMWTVPGACGWWLSGCGLSGL